MIAYKIITRSLRLLGVIATGETPEADQVQDALDALNVLAADLSAAQTLTQYAAPQFSYTAPGGLTRFTVGPTGEKVMGRPTSIANVFLRAGGMDYPVELIGEAEYQSIGLKSLVSSYPQWAWYEPEMPDGAIHLWPGLGAGQTLFFSATLPWVVFPDLYTDVDLPPSYERFLAYNLAPDLADDYEIQPSANIMRIAASTKRGVKRVNAQVPKLSNEAAHLSGNSDRINIISGR